MKIVITIIIIIIIIIIITCLIDAFKNLDTLTKAKILLVKVKINRL